MENHYLLLQFPRLNSYTGKLDSITDSSKDLRNVFDITPASLANLYMILTKDLNGRRE